MMSNADEMHPESTPDLFESLEAGSPPHQPPHPTEAKQKPAKRIRREANQKAAVKQPVSGGSASTAYLTDEDVARRFRVSRQTIWRWIGTSHFPAPFKLSAGTSRWRLEEILTFERKLPRYAPEDGAKNPERKRT
ncbi:putative transcriptional regulator (plasmid) [Ruegeria sp. TM1040]|nr:putative transcriptional regulator [Ruegeria sp. TM1040]